jgi:hypothetical protein
MSTRVVEEPSPTRLADKVVASAQGAGAASMFGLVVFWLLETYAHTVVPMPVTPELGRGPGGRVATDGGASLALGGGDHRRPARAG